MHFENGAIWTIVVDMNLNLKNSNKNHNFVSLNQNEIISETLKKSTHFTQSTNFRNFSVKRIREIGTL